MPGWLKSLLLLCCLLPAAGWAEEVIESYAVSLKVRADGMLQVLERITVQAEGGQIRRGIYRDIPTRYSLGNGLERRTPVQMLEVTRDGEAEPFHSEALGAGIRYYLGSAEHELEPGRYTYQLHYLIDAQLLQRDGEDELYWNVTGNDWSFPIKVASALVQLPAGARIGDVAGYTGGVGDNGTDYRVASREGQQLMLLTTRILQPGEGFTIAVDWQAGLVARPTRLQQIGRLIEDNPGLCVGLLMLLGLFAFYLWSWHDLGRDPRKGVIIPLFSAPEGLAPAAVGYLWKRGLRNGYSPAEALSVSFTDLAIRKQLSLADSPRGEAFVLSPVEAPRDDLQSHERALLAALFPNGKVSKALRVGSSYVPRLAAALEAHGAALSERGKQWFSLNRGHWWLGLVWALLGSLVSVFASVDGEEQVGLVIFGLVFTLGFGLAGTFLLIFGIKSWRAGGQDHGGVGLTIAGAVFIIPGLIGLGVLLSNVAPLVMGMLALFWLQVILFRGWLEAPSAEGRRLLDALEGYRDYLRLAESETLARAGTAPAMSIALYEQHLPYAMALQVEAAWTARFTAALDAGLIDPQLHEYRPDWYRSRSSFATPSALTGALVGGLSSATSSASTPPPSPSSSGSSSGGSSGGGSSGGGGGGGGGGGW